MLTVLETHKYEQSMLVEQRRLTMLVNTCDELFLMGQDAHDSCGTVPSRPLRNGTTRYLLPLTNGVQTAHQQVNTL